MTISAEKKLGHNTTFKQGSTTIAQVKRIKIPGYDRGEVEVTTLDSTIAEFEPGDPPEVKQGEVDYIWVGGLTSQELLQTSVQAKTNDTYSIVVNAWSTVRTATFTAKMISVNPADVESKNPMTNNAVLRPTSVITWS